MVKNWLYLSAERKCDSGKANCKRIAPASRPAMRKKQNAVTT
jgi:hypothetical protein